MHTFISKAHFAADYTVLAPIQVVNESAIHLPTIGPGGFMPGQVVNASIIYDALVFKVQLKNIAPDQVLNASAIHDLTISKPVTTSYDNPGGKGNRTATITVTFDGTLGGSSFINNLVDGAFTDTSADACWWHTGQSGRTLTFDFATPKVIQEAKFFASGTTGNGTWKWRGSNDGSNYADLSIAFTLAGATTGAICGDLSANNVAYRYYQLFQVSGATSNASWNREMEFKISA